MIWILDPYGNYVRFDTVTNIVSNETVLMLYWAHQQTTYVDEHAERMRKAVQAAMDKYGDVLMA